MITYTDFFALLNSGRTPYPYQERLAIAQTWPSVIEVPTGLGKTEAIVGAHLYRALELRTAEPRLLVYTLPMRSLVEQTIARIQSMLDALRVTDRYRDDQIPTVQALLGGDVSTDWVERPETRAIVVATQDMALSRALNRGYAVSRFKWPMAFGAISNDVLYVVDEVQLHGVGATTAAQLQGLSARFATLGQHHTVFVSATVDRERIDTVDHPLEKQLARYGWVGLTDEDRSHPRVLTLLQASKRVESLPVSDERELATAILDAHRPQSLTLVVVNTVKRARAVFNAVAARRGDGTTMLMHSRYRADDRTELASRLLDLDRTVNADAIVVTTQVVEAGIDISATTLISDLAPWSSIVQRLGRCNRRGEQNESARFLWIDDSSVKPAPYQAEDLETARRVLEEMQGGDASATALSKVDVRPAKMGGASVLRAPEFLDLFDTSADLSGNDVDISRFVRDGDENSVFLLWRSQPPTKIDPPRRDELCPALRDEVYAILDKLKNKLDALVINPLARNGTSGRSEMRWQRAQKPLRPGEVVWLDSSVGCYDAVRGFDPSLFGKQTVSPITRSRSVPITAAADDRIDDDGPTYIGCPVTLEQHSIDTRDAARELATTLLDLGLSGFSPTLADAVVQAAYWHDVGKAHPVFQNTMSRTLQRAELATEGGPWAKSVGFGKHERPHFRHELVSALCWIEAHPPADDLDIDLIAYLIAAHHGKLRMAAYTLAGEDGVERSILGVRDGEKMESIRVADGIDIPKFSLDLRNFFVGVQPDGPQKVWDDRVLRLRDRAFGPFRLAYLELLVRLADWRASATRADLTKRDITADATDADAAAAESIDPDHDDLEVA
ncbi:MAG: hypothetical protein NVSMB64_00020 [Candidatus Velthaea sp.]